MTDKTKTTIAEIAHKKTMGFMKRKDQPRCVACFHSRVRHNSTGKAHWHCDKGGFNVDATDCCKEYEQVMIGKT